MKQCMTFFATSVYRYVSILCMVGGSVHVTVAMFIIHLSHGLFTSVLDCYEDCKRKLLAVACQDIEQRGQTLPMPCKT